MAFTQRMDMRATFGRRAVSWGLRAGAATGLLVILTAGCGKVVEADPVPGSLSLVQGDQQSAQAGLELPNAIVVRLMDADGRPLAKFPVGFNVIRGGGAVAPASAVTDENGEVKTKWTLGPADMLQSLRASVVGLDPLEVTAIGLLPADLIIAQGNNQFAKPGSALPNQVVIRVVGENNIPMKGIAVAFQVTVGGGLISPASALTNALGEVQARWTLGPQPGTNTIVASSGRLQAVVLNAFSQ
ncbi:MAG: hypothetical protein MNPFHGCM_02469 [Gemmatimonadaceae bacterium]|nr:hypothetical protein [Gemmatimonadaceae bacterium]